MSEQGHAAEDEFPAKDGAGRGAPLLLIAALSAVLAAIYLTVALLVGPRTGNDTVIYSAWGDILRANKWDLGAFRDQVEFLGGTEIFYVAAATVFGGLKALLADDWQTGYVIFNWIALSATSAGMLLSLRRLGIDTAGLIVGALILGLLWEHVYWVAFVYTDISFNLILMAVFALFVAGLTAAPDGRPRPYYVLAFLLAIASAFYRPTGIWVAGILAVAFVAGIHRIPAASDPRAIIFRALGLAGGVTIVAWLGGSLLLANAHQMAPSVTKELVLFVGQYFAEGIIVRSRPETYALPPQGAADYAAMIGQKVIFYFKFSAVGFDRLHNLYNWITFTPFYALVIIGLGAVVAAAPRLSRPLLAAGLLSLFWILFFAVGHAVTIIDFDWRYRLPVYAPLTVLAVIGLWVIQDAGRRWIGGTVPERTAGRSG